jgi:hypothetical protein
MTSLSLQLLVAGWWSVHAANFSVDELNLVLNQNGLWLQELQRVVSVCNGVLFYMENQQTKQIQARHG